MEAKIASLGLCLFVVLAMAANADAYACTVGALYQQMSPCLGTVEQGAPVTQACCLIVKSLDVGCLCSHANAASGVPQSWVNNAIRLPKDCKRYDLTGHRCGAFTFP